MSQSNSPFLIDQSERDDPADLIPQTPDGSVAEVVWKLAEGATTWSVFLTRLIEHFGDEFAVDQVVLQSSGLPDPLHWDRGHRDAATLSPSQCFQHLNAANLTPVACDVAPDVQGTSPAQRVRVLQVLIQEQPVRIALLLVYHGIPDAEQQVRDLKRLKLYANAMQQIDTPLKTDDLCADQVKRHQVEGHQVEQHQVEQHQLNPHQANTNRNLPARPIPVDSHQPKSDGERHSGRPHNDGQSNGEQSNGEQSTVLSSQPWPLRLFHLDLDEVATSFRIANETRRLTAWDRVTVLVCRGKRFRAVAVSGVATIDRRSNVVRYLEQLVQASSVMRRTLVFPCRNLPPQIESRVNEYLDQSTASQVCMVPLIPSDAVVEDPITRVSGHAPDSSDPPLIGMLVLESFHGEVTSPLTETTHQIADEASLALKNCQEHQRIFGLPIWKAIGSVAHRGRMSWLLAAVALLIAMIAAGLVVPVEHYVVATGSIEPVMRRDVFAGVDGIVSHIHVSDGQQVTRGQVIAELQNAELDSRMESLLGEIQTVTQQLSSLHAVRLGDRSGSDQWIQSAVQERQLANRLDILRGQIEVLKLQHAELTVTSPIDGMVVGWQLEQRLLDRPIGRGDVLMSVADPESRWVLRLTSPGRTIGALLEAREQQLVLPVEFAVATIPGATFGATVQTLASAARQDREGQTVLDIVADIDPSGTLRPNTSPFDADAVRVDADVTARIYCGKRPALTSWFSDVVDFVHRQVAFYR